MSSPPLLCRPCIKSNTAIGLQISPKKMESHLSVSKYQYKPVYSLKVSERRSEDRQFNEGQITHRTLEGWMWRSLSSARFYRHIQSFKHVTESSSIYPSTIKSSITENLPCHPCVLGRKIINLRSSQDTHGKICLQNTVSSVVYYPYIAIVKEKHEDILRASLLQAIRDTHKHDLAYHYTVDVLQFKGSCFNTSFLWSHVDVHL